MEGITQRNFANILLVCAIAFISTVQGQRLDTDPATNLTVLENQSANITCRYGLPINYCRIEIPGQGVVLLSDVQESKFSGYRYLGEGLAAGQCGVTIERVKLSNHGPVKCFLGTAVEEFTAVVQLIVAVPPNPPELQEHSNNGGSYGANDKFEATCTSRFGRPPAQLSWFLNDEPIEEGLGNEVVTIDNSTLSITTTSQTITRYIRTSDDSKSLICRVNHPTGSQQQAARIQLHVKFPPQPQGEISVFGVVLGSTAYINVTINASPRPIIQWSVDGIKIDEGKQVDRYEANSPIDIGNQHFNATLTIAGLTLEDTTKQYLLKASNGLGVQDYVIRISSSEAAASAGLDTGSIVGIVVGVLLALIIIGIVIVMFARGYGCFSARGSGSPVGGDSERQSEIPKLDTSDAKVPAKTKKYNINFEGLFNRKKPIVQTNDDTNGDDAAPSEATVVIEDDPPKKGDKNLVYAELMLKPSDNDNPDKNSTEYAEIVYVTPPTISTTTGGENNSKVLPENKK